MFLQTLKKYFRPLPGKGFLQRLPTLNFLTVLYNVSQRYIRPNLPNVHSKSPVLLIKLNGEGHIDIRPSTDYLHQLEEKEEEKNMTPNI